MDGRVLVDSSIWVDALRNLEGSVADGVADLLRGPVRALTTGVVVQEVLQGVRAPRQVAQVATLLREVPYLAVTRETHERAAALYRSLRAAGLTPHTVDVLLAQLALDHRAALWTLDAHFTQLARRTKLRLHSR